MGFCIYWNYRVEAWSEAEVFGLRRDLIAP